MKKRFLLASLCSTALVLSLGGITSAQAVTLEPRPRPASKAAVDSTIYADALTGGWEDWSWETTRSFQNIQPVHSGSVSIAVTYTAAWGGLLLHTNTALSTSGYTAIRFWVHGGSTGGQSVNFHVSDGGLNYPFTVQANTWLQVTVPLATIGNPATLSDLFWQDNNGNSLGQPTFYLDDISLTTPFVTTITRLSLDSSGVQGNHASYDPSISADGRYVAFPSDASNLVSGDTNGDEDVFLRETRTGITTRLSVDSSGMEANDSSSYHSALSISADGRFVAFSSRASNLVSADTNGVEDVFLRDIQTGTTTRLSVNSSGTQGNDWSDSASISADGRYVAFRSLATNLVSGDANGTGDIFLRDTQLGITTLISVDTSGAQGNGYSSYSPSISADGRYVAFTSDASNLVSGDTNGWNDVFLHDTQTGITTRISLSSNGTQGNDDSLGASISADGRYVAFNSYASNLVAGDTNGYLDIFLRDTQTGTTTRLSLSSNGTQGNGLSSGPSISANGRYVTFTSAASNLVSGDTNGWNDVFLHDVQTGITTRLSLDSNGTQANGPSSSPSLSADGRYVAFTSEASNLVSGDTNGVSDDFIVPAAGIFILTAIKTGTGSGTVTSSPAGIDCGLTACYTYFDFNTTVTLTATAAANSVFNGWNGGGCSGTGSCTLTMDAVKSVTADFTLLPRLYLPIVLNSFGAPHIPYVGVNLAGADFGEDVLPGTYGVNYIYPTAGEVEYFTGKKMTIFRLPFRWERLQQTQLAGFNAAEQTRMDTFVNYATGKGAYVLLDPHNYARYYGNIIGESAVPVAAYMDFWSRLANHYRSNSRVIFGLMNEPNSMSTELWESDANAAIQAIRATGATNLILVPGNGWSGAASWGQNWYGTANAVAMLGITDSGNNYAFEVHQYLDSDGSGTSSTCVSSTIGSERMAFFTSWLRQNNKRGFLGEFGGSTNATCLAALDNILTHLDQNSDVYLGWTYWAAGPWWGDYFMSLEPVNGVDRPQMTPLSLHLP